MKRMWSIGISLIIDVAFRIVKKTSLKFRVCLFSTFFRNCHFVWTIMAIYSWLNIIVALLFVLILISILKTFSTLYSFPFFLVFLTIYVLLNVEFPFIIDVLGFISYKCYSMFSPVFLDLLYFLFLKRRVIEILIKLTFLFLLTKFVKSENTLKNFYPFSRGY